MSIRPSSYCCVAMILLAATISFSTFAAPQLVTALNPSFGAAPDGNGDSWAPIISGDGRFVLFASTANNLVPGTGSNGIPELNPQTVNVYLRDRLKQSTTLVSVSLDGTGGGNANSYPTALSTNGQFALFESASSNLAANATNNLNQVYRRDVVNGITLLVSVGTNGASPNGAARGSTMTPDGSQVAFVSTSSNLVSNDTNGLADVFWRNMLAQVTVLVSVGAVANGGISTSSVGVSSSEWPEITPDGRYVVFSSSATNLVPGIQLAPRVSGQELPAQIYVRDLRAGTTSWASTNVGAIFGPGTNCLCFNQAISDNGQYVAFEVCSNTMPEASPPATGIILYYNQQTGLTEIVSTNAVFPQFANADARSLSMTPDGQNIVYTATNGAYSTSAVYLWNASAGTNTLVSANSSGSVTPGTSAYFPDIDPTGRYVLFVSTDTNYTASSNAPAAILLRDTQAGTTTVVSVDTNGLSLPVNATAVPALSADAGSVAFESLWANLDGRNFQSDVFAVTLTNNPVSQLVSVRDPNLPSSTANGPAALWPGSASANGRYMVFSTWANNLLPGDTNDCINVYERDRITGANILVSVGTNGVEGNNLSTEPSVSGDGRYVAFTSFATNLLGGDANLSSDVFVRDMQEGLTTMVSVSTNGGFGNGSSYLPQISADGRYVLFCSAAENLAAGTYGSNNLYLRDLQLGQTYALTQGGFASEPGNASFSMTPDGKEIAFIAVSNGVSTLYVWQTSLAAMIYTNSFSAQTNISLSADGRWLACVSNNVLCLEDLVAGTNFQIASGVIGPRAGLSFSTNDDFLAYAMNTNVYLYSFQTGSNLLISSGPADSPVVSADGSFVAYRSFSSNAIPQNPDGEPVVLLFDTFSNSTTLASANLSGFASAQPSLDPVFSADGQTLAFQSWANDLAGGEFGSGGNVFALDVFGLPGTLNATNSAPALDAGMTFQSDYSSGQIPVVAWPFIPDQSYIVQYKDNLTDPVWYNLNGVMTFLGNQAYLADPAPLSNQRFYRVVQGSSP
jgi:Tol biopolymer transport system component